MQRLCGDNIYAFTDARATERDVFFNDIAANNGLNIYKPTSKSPIILGLSALNGVPYYQWAHGGVFNVFFNAGIPTLNLIGANWESSNLSDIESASNENISFTESDTLHNLKRFYPDYAQKMATAATLVVKSLTDERFLQTMQNDRESFPDTDAISSAWIWELVVLITIIIAGIALYAVIAHQKKKYPIEVKAPPHMKMAVFGMDYEDKSSADIFIDIRDVNANEDIFPGISNNAPKPKNTVDDIFTLGDRNDGGADKTYSADVDKKEDKDDPFDNDN